MTTTAPGLVQMWSLSRRTSPGDRAAALLLALDGPAALAYPLGTRNLRLLAVHRAVVRRPIEAHVDCPGCGTANEFELPVAALAALPMAADDAVAHVAGAAFRLPVLADLTTLAGGVPVRDLGELAARACLDPPAPPLSRDGLDRLAEAWEALDPAGSVRVVLSCAGCGHDIAADADPAEFVARDLDHLVDGLMREVDVIAGGYGWSEEAILAMPAPRRRRYMQLILERSGAPR